MVGRLIDTHYLSALAAFVFISPVRAGNVASGHVESSILGFTQVSAIGSENGSKISRDPQAVQESRLVILPEAALGWQSSLTAPSVKVFVARAEARRR